MIFAHRHALRLAVEGAARRGEDHLAHSRADGLIQDIEGPERVHPGVLQRRLDRHRHGPRRRADVPPPQHALIIPVVHPPADPQTYQRLDPQRMIDLVVRFPEMGEEAWQTAMRLRLQPSGEYTAIAVLGMGGAGGGGGLLAALLRPVFPVPVVVVKARRLPAFVGPQTLVFACSYSGNTEETINAYTAAKQAGAPTIGLPPGGA